MKTPILCAATAVAISVSTASADVVRCLTEPFRDVQMSTIVPGNVAIIHYGEGTFVEKGDVIMELDSSTEQLDIKRRKVLAENLKATLDRSEMLLKNTSSISMEEVDESRSEYQLAAIELELALDGLGKKQLEAPFSGIVTHLPIEVGEYCEPPQIILRMVDTRQFFCVANIDPGAASKLEMDGAVAYLAETGSGKVRVEGRIVFISPVLDPASGLLRIKAVFDNPEGLVRPGEGGYLELEPDS
jgi:RND family efflux transporter MFP subunit